MLPDISSTKHEIERKATLYIRDKIGVLWPLSRMIRSVTQHEGTFHSYEQEGGRIVSQAHKEFAAPFEVKLSEIPTLVGPALAAKLDAVAEAIAQQEANLFYQRLAEESSMAGTAVDAHGKPFSQELYLEALERRDVEFDDHRRSKGIMTASPKDLPSLQQKLSEWFQDPCFRKRHDEIMLRKYEDWRDRESDRKLVD